MKFNKLILSFLAVGFGETIGQVLLLRELTVNFQGNELSLGIIFANWLFLVAMGSYGAGKLIERKQPKIIYFVFTQILFFFILPILILFSRNLNYLIGLRPGEIAGIQVIFWSSLLLLAPLCLLNGIQFTLGCHNLSSYPNSQTPSAGRIYVAEALGCFLGGVVFTFLLVNYLEPLKIALLTGIINLIFALPLLEGRKNKLLHNRGTFIFKLTLVILIFLSILFGLSGGLDYLHLQSRKWQWRGEEFIFDKDSFYGNIAITKKGDQINFYESGLLLFTSPSSNTIFLEELAHFPLLTHLAPNKVLLIGGGLGGLLEEIIKHPVKEVHYVELDELLIEIAKKKISSPVLSDPKIKLILTDGRTYVKNTPQKYEVIIINLPPPSTLNINRFYTQEFFQETNKILNKNGLLAFCLPGSETYLNPELLELNGCVYESLRRVFNLTKIIPGNINIFLGIKADNYLPFEKGEWEKRLFNNLLERKLEVKIISPYYINYKLSENVIIKKFFSYLTLKDRVDINQDLKPRAAFLSLSHWNAMFGSTLRNFTRWITHIKLWWFVPLHLIIGLFLTFGKNKSVSKVIKWSIFSTGFTGMTVNILILLTFQTLEGHLYQKIGLFASSFMLGLVVGGTMINKLLQKIKNKMNSFIYIEISILVFVLLISLIFIELPYFTEMKPIVLLFAGTWTLVLLNGITGLLVGLEFPLANSLLQISHTSPAKIAGSLYALDLWGAIFGALLTAIIFLPLLGAGQTLIIPSMAKLISIIFLINHHRRLV